MCVGVGNDVQVAQRKQSRNCKVEMRVQAADANGTVLSTTDLNEAIALHNYILLYAGIHPTPGLLLSLQDNSVVHFLYSMMARAIPLWGCSRLLWIQRGNGEWGSDTSA